MKHAFILFRLRLHVPLYTCYILACTCTSSAARPKCKRPMFYRGAGPDPAYLHLAAGGHPEHEDPAAPWSPGRRPSPCPECEAAAAAMRQPAFHWCVHDAVVSAVFRSHVGPIERPPKKTPSPPPLLPLPPSPGRLLGMPVYEFIDQHLLFRRRRLPHSSSNCT